MIDVKKEFESLSLETLSIVVSAFQIADIFYKEKAYDFGFYLRNANSVLLERIRKCEEKAE